MERERKKEIERNVIHHSAAATAVGRHARRDLKAVSSLNGETIRMGIHYSANARLQYKWGYTKALMQSYETASEGGAEEFTKREGHLLRT